MGGTAEFIRPLHRNMQGIFHVQNETCKEINEDDCESLLADRHICLFLYRARARDRDEAKRNRGCTAKEAVSHGERSSEPRRKKQ